MSRAASELAELGGVCLTGERVEDDSGRAGETKELKEEDEEAT